MTVQVDTIESLLVANVGKYIADMDTATAAFKRFKAEHGATSSANDDTAVEQSAARQTATRRKQATDEAALAKTTADATNAAEKEKQASINATAVAIEKARLAEEKFQATQSKRAESNFYAAGKTVFDAKAREFAAIDRAKDLAEEQAEQNAIRRAREETTADTERLAQAELLARRRARLQDLQEEQAAAREKAALAATPTAITITGGNVPRSQNIRTTGEEGDRSTAARQTEIMAQTRVETEGVAAAEREINEAKVQQISNSARLTAARGADRDILKSQNLEISQMIKYEREGLTIEQAAIRTEADLLAIAEAKRKEAELLASAQGKNNLLRFGEAAGIGRTGGGAAAIGGLVAGAAVVGGVEAVKSATDYAKALSDVSKEAGISTTALQVYQHAAVDAGAKSTDFDTALLHLGDSLGRARTGSQEQAKVFAALGVDIKNGASAGELLPTLIDRISSIADQSKRARVEVALFGEGGEKLDGLLSGGNAKVNELAAGLERTGAVLSSSDIAKLDDVSKKLESVKAQLAVDLAEVVAGNATAIKSLADSFAELGNFIGGAIDVFERFKATLAGSDFVNAIVTVLNPLRQAEDIINTGKEAYDKVTGNTPGKKLTDSLNQSFADQRAAGDFAPVQSGNVNNALLDKLGAGKGRKGPDLQKQEEEREKYVNDTLAQLDAERLAANKASTADDTEQASFSRQELETQRQKALDDILTNSQLKKLKVDQIDKLKKAIADTSEGSNDRLDDLIGSLPKGDFKNLLQAAEKTFAAKANVINFDDDKKVQADLLALENQTYDLRKSELESQKGLADTSAKRREIDLKLLALAEQHAKDADADILADATRGPDQRRYTDEQIAAAQARAAAAPAQHDLDVRTINQQDASPGQQYVKSLKSTSDTLQDTGVTALKSLNSELDKSVEKSLHLHGIFGSIVDDLIDMAIKQALIKPLASAFFGDSASGTNGLFGSLTGGGGSGGGIGGLFGKLLGAFGGGGGGGGFSDLFGLASTGGAASSLAVSPVSGLEGLLAHFANGGSFQVGGNGGVDQNTLSINSKPVARVGQGETVAVIPQGQMAGSRGGPMTLQQTISIDARNSVTPGDFANQIIQVSADHANRVAAQAGRGAVQASPARVNQANQLGNG